MTTVKLLSAVDLKSRFKKIAPFMSTDDTRYYLNGVYFEYKNQHLKATATNGQILCSMEWELNEESEDGEFNIICPALAVKHLLKIISAKSATDGGVLLNVSEDRKYIEFDFFDYKYKVACVDGTFPDYTKVIPNANERITKGLNAKYLVSVLSALGNSPVNIEVDKLEGVEGQAHLFSSDDEDGIKCVILPMRV